MRRSGNVKEGGSESIEVVKIVAYCGHDGEYVLYFVCNPSVRFLFFRECWKCTISINKNIPKRMWLRVCALNDVAQVEAKTCDCHRAVTRTIIRY